MKRAFICIADGFEEVEAVTPLDYLRRAGIETILVGVDRKTIRSARNVSISTDTILEDVYNHSDTVSLVVLPGGMQNSKTLGSSEKLRVFVSKVYKQGGLIGAICAAPVFTLGAWGLLDGKQFTCYPGMETMIQGGLFTDKRVVRDGQIITSYSAGSAEEFSFALIEQLCGTAAAEQLRKAIAAR